jgi:hypothetical protein
VQNFHVSRGVETKKQASRRSCGEEYKIHLLFFTIYTYILSALSGVRSHWQGTSAVALQMKTGFSLEWQSGRKLALLETVAT